MYCHITADAASDTAAGIRYSERTIVTPRNWKLINIANPSEMNTVGMTPIATKYKVFLTAIPTIGSLKAALKFPSPTQVGAPLRFHANRLSPNASRIGTPTKTANRSTFGPSMKSAARLSLRRLLPSRGRCSVGWRDEHLCCHRNLGGLSEVAFRGMQDLRPVKSGSGRLGSRIGHSRLLTS